MLDLSVNEFSGELPTEVADMKSLKYLMLAFNKFSGGIPPVYGRLSELQALDLSNNMLTGEIPASVGNLTSLLWLMLAGNQLSGEIPPEIGNCSSLLWLNLADNRLTGSIPPEMAAIGRNPGPTFAKNRNDPSVLAGSGECQAMKRWIPASYTPFSFVYSVMTRENCRSIWDRILKGHWIPQVWSETYTDTIPGYVGLSRNLLSGDIPPEIGVMRNLRLLNLDDNRLTGKLPPEIGRLPLVWLNVSRNRHDAVGDRLHYWVKYDGLVVQQLLRRPPGEPEPAHGAEQVQRVLQPASLRRSPQHWPVQHLRRAVLHRRPTYFTPAWHRKETTAGSGGYSGGEKARHVTKSHRGTAHFGFRRRHLVLDTRGVHRLVRLPGASCS
ncbi:hypothetical protein ACP4OV_019032 [Aristida adscensionis]